MATSRKSTKTTKKAAKAELPKIADALREFGFPSQPGRGLCFRAEDDDRFELGYPNLRLLTDDPVGPDEAFKKAEAALDAIDPCFRITISRSIARCFLLGYRIGPLLFVDPNHSPKNAKLRVERAELMRSDRQIDQTLLDETLDSHGYGMGDTYSSWRWPKVLYLYEGFIGAEAVARSVVRFLIDAATNLKKWGFAGEDQYRTNAAAHAIALALPWILRRVPESGATELRAKLAKLPRPDDLPIVAPPAYFAILHFIADPTEAPHETLGALDFELALRRDDQAFVAKKMASRVDYLFAGPARVCWLIGTSALAAPFSISGHDLPRLVDQFAPFRDPGVVRIMAKIASQRAGKKAAGDWLVEHAEYALPILNKLASLGDEKETKAANAALDLIESAKKKQPIVEEPKLDEEALEREIEDIFKALGKRLRKAPNQKEEIAAIQDAYEAYKEARSAAGDPIPEAYFTHRFGDFDLGKWAMLAVDAID